MRIWTKRSRIGIFWMELAYYTNHSPRFEAEEAGVLREVDCRICHYEGDSKEIIKEANVL